MAKKGTIVWVPKGAFVMPEIPKSLKVDPLLAGVLHAMSFFELSDEDTVDEDWAVEAMEAVTYYLQRMTPVQIADMAEQLDRVAKHAKKKKMPGPFIEFVEEFMVNSGLVEDED